MGREAQCACRWGDRTGRVTALLEPGELIVRGDFRARVARAQITHVAIAGDALEFVALGERVALDLGAPRARRWAAALATAPPTLARKLGITPATRLAVTGSVDDDALRDAMAAAAEIDVSPGEADLTIVRTDDRAGLSGWLAAVAGCPCISPVWVVYVKGRAAPLGESAVREAMRRRGFIDTKVAAVSERLTALRFVKRS